MSTRCETVGTAADDRASVRASRAARDDSGERYVYVGNLDFFDDPADVRRYLAAALARATPACPVPASIAVPGWGSGPRVDQRKRRDEGKLNRGFAVLEFADADAGRAAAAALDGAVVNGRALRSSPGVAVKKDDGGDPSDDDGGGGGEDEAAVRARAERRAHNRRQRRRRKQRDAAELGEKLERLMRTHPLWGTDESAATRRARRSVAADSSDDDTWRDGWWDDDTWREGWGSLYSVWASKDDATGLGFVDWAKCPPAADPAGSNKRGGAARGTRKRLQVESFRAVVSAAATTLGLGPGGSKRRPTIVDFGCGTGNLLLPLAAQHPEADFVGLDLNPRSIDLLSARARDAGLANVAARVGLIEEYEGPCDLALALHVCGSGTDAVLLQAQARGAAFVVAPCCIGKLRDGGLKSVAGMKNAISTADGDGDGDGDGSWDDELVVRPGGGMPPLTVIHPRSRWMRGEVQRPAYMDMAAAADWSGHAGVDAMEAFTGELGRLPRAAKAAVELDRGAAAAEAGYGVRMMKMLHPGAGLKNDVIIGFAGGADPLREHVFGPDAGF